ncbi:hypothetical protein BIT28_12965 [Photobacterium proteolyticum]|uniref:Uracil-DNA glycosylase-like domain-containing protein n=1 Tax=Photobacterium proteolyticum TaxID=1903952 RepID=A0A1Q9GK36_9GAMM|nr:hypothetical protein [Photobacterium proteolyticum]OLQ74866.1 hypothetical protein BIT28_12965 [Photobacterium proteolyticum]
MDSVLKEKYKRILSTINSDEFSFENDKYSGVFLTYPFEAYRTSKIKVMIVGRETAGWNTNNGKNTIKRIVDKNKLNQLDDVVNESLSRYSWHLKDRKDGRVRTKHRSHFKRFFLTVAKELKVEPEGIVYANLFAWDFNKRSPLRRPKQELEKITNLSIELLAEQIRLYEPEHIIFATGVLKVDPIIKKLFVEQFQGYKTNHVEPKKLWQFEAAGARCYRIAHPRAMGNEHPKFRQKVIGLIKKAD